MNDIKAEPSVPRLGSARSQGLTVWHRFDRFMATMRPRREPLSLVVDGVVVALAWNATYLFRLGFERWIHARPDYDHWVLLGVLSCT